LILTYLTPDKGKLTAIAKSARSSTRRFCGSVELLSVSGIVCTQGRGRLPLLTEASPHCHFQSISSDIRKMAYACYWAEILDAVIENDGRSPEHIEAYELLLTGLKLLDDNTLCDCVLNIGFQMKFLNLSGIGPNLIQCGGCRRPVENFSENRFAFDTARGTALCRTCYDPEKTKAVFISKGTAKQLQWVEGFPLTSAGRIRFSARTLNESRNLLESFVPYHLGKTFRSLTFLGRILPEPIGATGRLPYNTTDERSQYV
jgi:DNA repair protein RecO (recombination protein O)